MPTKTQSIGLLMIHMITAVCGHCFGLREATLQLLLVHTLGLCIPLTSDQAAASQGTITAPLHQPQTAIPIDAERILIANGQNPTLTIVRTTGETSVRVVEIGYCLCDLVQIPKTPCYLGLVRDEPLLLVISCTDKSGKDQFRVEERIALHAIPARIALSEDASIVCITFAWSSTVCIAEVKTAESNTTIELSDTPIHVAFPCQEVIATGNRAFIVADRFGGSLFVIEGIEPTTVRAHSLPGHNIRGLSQSVDRNSILIAHQILSPIARTTVEDIHWGLLMQNVVSVVPFKSLDNSIDRPLNKRIVRLGKPDSGFADPTGLIATQQGFVVSSQGTGGIAFVDKQERVVIRSIKGNPSRLKEWSNGRLIAIDALNNRVTVLRFDPGDKTLKVVTEIVGTNRRLTSAERGALSFYDASISRGGWMSCHSCHSDGHSPDLLADTLGDGTFGTPKRVPSLLGVSKSGPWGWDGSKHTLEQQVEASLLGTMLGESNVLANAPLEDNLDATQAIIDYLRTLSVPQNPKFTGRLATMEIASGRDIYVRLDCHSCHEGDSTIGGSVVFDVGTQDEAASRRFNPPSFQGLWLRRSYMHDSHTSVLSGLIYQLPRSSKT